MSGASFQHCVANSSKPMCNKALVYDGYVFSAPVLEFLRQLRGAFGRFLMGDIKCEELKGFDLPFWYHHFFDAQKAPYGPEHRTRQPFVLQYLGQDYFRFIYLGYDEKADLLLDIFFRNLEKYLHHDCKIEDLNKQIINLELTPTPAEMLPCPIVVRFQTPFILKEIKNEINDFTFERFWLGIFRHLADEIKVEYDENLRTLSKQNLILQKQLKRVAYQSFSGRQKQEFADFAIEGQFVLSKEAWPFLPFLHIAQVFSFGKKRSFGFGSFQIFLLDNGGNL